jgi:hypothetical protein
MSNITVKATDRIRVVKSHEILVIKAGEAGDMLAAVLNDDNIVVDIHRSNMLRNARTLFDVTIHNGSGVVLVNDGMTVEEANAFFAGMRAAMNCIAHAADAMRADDDDDSNAAEVLAEAA